MIKPALFIALLGFGAVGRLLAEDAPADQLAEGGRLVAVRIALPRCGLDDQRETLRWLVFGVIGCSVVR